MIKKFQLPALLGALLALAGGGTQAALLEYAFTTPQGLERSLPPSTGYINPVGEIRFSLSAGLDRKVKISVLKLDGTVVSTATSPTLGSGDRITVGGKSYYGAELHLPAPEEGEYQLKAEMLSAQGSPVETETFPFVVDVTPPEVQGDFYWQIRWIGQRKHTDGQWIVSLTLASDAGFTQVSDLGSGLTQSS